MILLRHAQSEFNAVYSVTRRDPGIHDPSLTAEGRVQARAAAEALAPLGVNRLVTSPYTRALETAEIVAGLLSLPVTVEPLVRERAVFACDIGTSRNELLRRWPRFDFDHIEEQWWHAPEETEAQLLARCERFRALMAATPSWPELAVITHWGFIRGLTGHAIANSEMVAFDPTEPG